LKADRKYVIAVALAVLAVAFGLAGTVAPPLSGSVSPSTSSSSSDPVTHFANPPTYDSDWVDIRSKLGQYVTLKHNLNATDVVVDMTGKQSLEAAGGTRAWSAAFGGTGADYAYCVIQTSDGGYALAGYTNSPPTAGGDDFWLVKTDASGNKLWSQTYGGTGTDRSNCVIQTADGGYALAGYTDSAGTAGGDDFWLVKTSSNGTLEWSEMYGGSNLDRASCVVQTSDGGYALAGHTNSPPTIGGYDFWLIKTWADGSPGWYENYGGTGTDIALSVVQTSDRGYALAGYTNSPPTAGLIDFYLVKAAEDGGEEWDQNYGGTEYDFAYSVVQTGDGGYALAGCTNSPPTAGGYDFWSVKTGADGTPEWDQKCGGTGYDHAYSVVQTNDGGYAIAGYTGSFGAGGYDFWLVRADASGNTLWNQTYGGASPDQAYSVVQTSDGGYALAGAASSFGTSYDFLLVRVNAEMDLEHQMSFGRTGVVPGWSRTYGDSSGQESGKCVVQTADGGYALAGYTNSPGTAGSFDFWLVKTDASGNKLWSQMYGGTGVDIPYSLIQTADGGYALAGYTSSPPTAGSIDSLLVKTDADGNLQWSKKHGGINDDYTYSLIQTADGGYALAGYTFPGPLGSVDAWLVKTDKSGDKLWDQTYGGTGMDDAMSVIQTTDGGYALAGDTNSPGTHGDIDMWLVKTAADGTPDWSQMYGGTYSDRATCVVQTADRGYALAGFSASTPALVGKQMWLVRTDAAGNMQWNQIYGGTRMGEANSLAKTRDGGYALAGLIGGGFATLVKTDAAGNMQWTQVCTISLPEVCSMVQANDGGFALGGTANDDFCLVKTDVETGLAWTSLTNNSITLYRGKTDPNWNYVRVRIWIIQEPTWMYGDINMDGIVDAKDLYILSRNYGKTFSLLSLSGIIAIAGISTYKKRKHEKN